MTKQIETTISINAPASKVWEVLTDLEAHQDWNPFISFTGGEPTVGSQLVAQMSPEGQKPRTFKPVVLAADTNQEFRWLGKLGPGKLFDGEHYFQLSESDGRTTLTHGEVFNGILVGPMWKKVEPPTKASFIAMNEALKKTCEA